MAAVLIDGKGLASRLTADVAEEVSALRRAGRPVRLAAVLAGDDVGALLYAENQRRRCEELGIGYELVHLSGSVVEELRGRGVLEARLLGEVRRLNASMEVSGIMLHLPMPEGVSATRLQFEIDPFKDVEGVNPANLGFIFYDRPILLPCTALAVLELIGQTPLALRGAEAVVVGQSGIVGKPITSLLIRREATVTATHIATRDVAEHCRRADLVVVAVGRPGVVDGGMIRRGAVVVDVGINRVSMVDERGERVSRTVGDCSADVADVAGWLTPVPGGVGPMTVAMLMRNTVEAVRKQMARGAGG